MSDGPVIEYLSSLQSHLNILSTNEYIEMNSDKNPELVDFAQMDIGSDFTTDFKLEELKGDVQIYEPHLKLEDILTNKGNLM